MPKISRACGPGVQTQTQLLKPKPPDLELKTPPLALSTWEAPYLYILTGSLSAPVSPFGAEPGAPGFLPSFSQASPSPQCTASPQLLSCSCQVSSLQTQTGGRPSQPGWSMRPILTHCTGSDRTPGSDSGSEPDVRPASQRQKRQLGPHLLYRVAWSKSLHLSEPLCPSLKGRVIGQTSLTHF